MPYHASGGLYNRVFLPEQLYVIQIESCHCFFLNVKGRFALPCSKEQIAPFTTQALGPTNHWNSHIRERLHTFLLKHGCLKLNIFLSPSWGRDYDWKKFIHKREISIFTPSLSCLSQNAKVALLVLTCSLFQGSSPAFKEDQGNETVLLVSL